MMPDRDQDQLFPLRKRVTGREFAAILAGLRTLQALSMSEWPDGIWEVVTNGGAFGPITRDGIDSLCEYLNGEED